MTIFFKRTSASYLQQIILLASIAGGYFLALTAYRAEYFADDGAFFLRYAENISNGYFWYWNIQEPPIWGASAPFWPVLVAIFVYLGLSSTTAIITVGYLTALSALLLITFLVMKHFGFFTAIVLAAFFVINSIFMYFALSGLESPLTYLLIALAIFVTLTPTSPWVVGLLAGLLMVHKIDLIPVAGLLLISEYVKTRKLPIRAFVLMMVIAIAWYGFAAYYFGTPVPNSFLTKLEVSYGNLPVWWFFFNIAIRGVQKVLFLFALFALIPLWKNYKPFLIFCVGTILIHTVAYTFQVPPEPFDWYHVPSRLLVTVLAAIGFSYLVDLLIQRVTSNQTTAIVIGTGTLVVITLMGYYLDRPHAFGTISFANQYEADRTHAGLWVAEHTPADARVYTGFGNTSYWSQRYVYDYSFLNRVWEPGDMIAKYNPEILILCPNRTGIPPEKYQPRDGYKVARIFDSAYQAGKDFYTVVMFREDVPLSR